MPYAASIRRPAGLPSPGVTLHETAAGLDLARGVATSQPLGVELRRIMRSYLGPAVVPGSRPPRAEAEEAGGSVRSSWHATRGIVSRSQVLSHEPHTLRPHACVPDHVRFSPPSEFTE